MPGQIEAEQDYFDYDYSNFHYSSSDDVFAILEPYTEWYDDAQGKVMEGHPEFYAQVTNRGATQRFRCERVEAVPTSAYCIGPRTPLGEPMELALYASQDDRLLAVGSFVVEAVAHHADDQAETILLRLLRGGGAGGIAAMRARSPDGRVVRPFLPLRRVEIEAYLRGRGVVWRSDASNEDQAFLRNRVRHELLPLRFTLAKYCPTLRARSSGTSRSSPPNFVSIEP